VKGTLRNGKNEGATADMRCPKCGERLKGIPPLSEEEWICNNPDCTHYGREVYGVTQKEVNAQIQELQPK